MKALLFILNLLVFLSAHGQNFTSLQPTIGKSLDFGPEVQKEWRKRDQALKSLAAGERTWDELTEGEHALLNKYGEVYESMWDVLGGGCDWYCGGGVSSIKASSFLKAQGEINYDPSNAHDFSYQTAWVEGVKGYGIGEYLEYEFPPEGPRINTIIVVNGYVKSQTSWEDNSRVKQLKMYLDGEPFAILNLEDVAAEQVFKINPIGHSDRENWEELKKKESWKVRFEILDVYKGKKYDDVVISEIYFDGLDVHCFGKGTMIRMADGSEKRIEDLVVGDEVTSYNQNRGSYESSRVFELANPNHDNLVELVFHDGGSITVTEDHPFFDGNQWMSLNPAKTIHDYDFENVTSLEVGGKLLGPSGEFIIQEIRQIEAEQETYTIVKLDRNNTFIANGVLVGTEELRDRKNSLAHSYSCPLYKGKK